MATGWDLVLLLGILFGSTHILLAGAVGLGQYLRLRRRRGSLEPGPAWLSGTAQPIDNVLTAPISSESVLCVEWVIQREGGKVARRFWRTVETGRDGVWFTIHTDRGRVRVDPATASLDLPDGHTETFDDPAALRKALPATNYHRDFDGADRYRLVERRLSAGDSVDATGTLRTSDGDNRLLAGSDESSILRRFTGVPFVLADPARDGGGGVLRDRALAGFVLGVPPALLSLVLLFPP